jgi:acyl CoA:acetate/3-ketoacid CoA transferase alpha subunit
MDYKPSTQQSVMAGVKAYDVNEFKATTNPLASDACRQVRANADGEYKFYFEDRPDTAITMAVKASEQLNYAIVKITGTDDSVVAAGKLLVVY